jgi:Ca2+-binding RTX toxin-like protein
MTNIVSADATATGTGSEDMIVAVAGGATQVLTRSGGAGNDVMIASGQRAVLVDAVAGNNSIANAVNIDAVDYWSLSRSPIVGNSSIPHAQIVGTGAGEKDYFAVTLAAGQTLSLDVDFGMKTGVPLGGPSFDPMTEIFNEAGQVLARNDDTYTDPGSVHFYDSALGYTAVTGGTYYFAVSRYSGYSAIPTGATYLLNVLVTGHAVADGVVAGPVVLNGEAGQDYLYGADGDDVLDGGAGNDVLEGGVGADLMIGGAGDDRMRGGIGDDSYYVDSVADVVIEEVDGGIDTIYSSSNVGLVLPNFVENLVLTGTGSIGGWGNVLSNRITGNDGDNLLDGGLGADTLIGGLGDDRYIVDNLGDVVIEDADAGIDTVRSATFSQVLSDNVENLELLGSSDLRGVGNALDNRLSGNNGANVLDGGEGADWMAGGRGNDIYYVDNDADQVVEEAGPWTDSVYSVVNWTLSANVENLVLQGDGDLRGFGNDGSNRITGNDGDNVLDGLRGADWMAGGLGDDMYYIDKVSDVVVEEADAGSDTIHSIYSWTLGANVENLVLQGGGNLRGFGNDLANRITGNDGDNVLDGKKGADWMAGGIGNDVYYIDNVGDVVVEEAGAGIDTVHSIYSLFLGDNVENLVLRGGGNLRGIGNALDNAIIGNDGANDIYGKGGADVLTGGLGADRFFFDTAPGEGNVDVITDFVVGEDRIVLDDAVFAGVGAPGGLGAGQFRDGAAADPSDRILYDSATGSLFYDADGDGAGAAVLFARVEAGLALSHADFAIV